MIDKEEARELLVALAASTVVPWRPIPSRDLSRILGVSLQTLANWRVRGTGPQVEPYKRGQGNRTFYRPDKVMSWLSSIRSERREPWQFCHEWLVAKGLDNMEAQPEVVENFTIFADRHGYFGGIRGRRQQIARP